MDPTKDRFGIDLARILRTILDHGSIIRDGSYVPTRHEVATAKPKWLEMVLLGWWWESPTLLIPTDWQVEEVVKILRARPDADSDTIQRIIAQAPPADE